MPVRNRVALAAELFVTRLALEVIIEESAQGWSFPGASRPLFTHEVTAHTRFGDLDDASTAAARAITGVTDPLWSSVLDDLLSDLLDNSDSPTDTARRLADLRGGSGVLKGYTTKIEDAAAAIYQASLTARHEWAKHTLTEAIAQGVNPGLLPDTNRLVPNARERDYLRLRAEEVAQHPLTRMLDVANRVVTSKNLLEVDPAGLVDEIADELRNTPHDGTNDLGRQLVHDAGNQGRAQVATSAPKPKYVYGSELLDTNTCGPCAEVDGKRWETIEAASQEYPQGGGYRDCDGGRRCRGTLVYVWDEADPTVGAPERPDPEPENVVPDAAPEPEPEFVDRLTGMLLAGKVTPERLREQAAKASALGKANADAALAQYEREMADRAAAAPKKFQNVREARKWANDHWAGPEGYPDDELKVLRDYTGSGYGPMNSVLRDSKGKRTNAKIRKMDEAIERAGRVPERVEVVRNANLRQLGINTTTGDPRNLIGSEFVDHGYMSTSLSRAGAMQGEVRMILNVPPGAKGIYVSGDGGKKSQNIISDYGGGESEIILARGSRFIVRKVSKVGKRWHVEADIVQE